MTLIISNLIFNDVDKCFIEMHVDYLLRKNTVQYSTFYSHLCFVSMNSAWNLSIYQYLKVNLKIQILHSKTIFKL